jgi:agmatinase
MNHISDEYATFGGLTISKENWEEADALIQGIPYESATSGKKGTSFAVKALRNISRDMQILSRAGVDIGSCRLVDLGDVPINPLESSETRENIFQNTKNILSKSTSPLISIGGDHSVTYPLIKAFAEFGTVGIVWIDAHRDVLDTLMNSRFSHGSSLRRSLELNQVHPENVLMIGTRYMTREEEAYVNTLGINEIRKVDMELVPFPEVLGEITAKINDIASRVDNLYISIDIDGLDPSCAPGTGTPVAGGLSSSELLGIISHIPVRIRGFDIVEVSPPLDTSGITVKTMMSILTEILAQIVNSI